MQITLWSISSTKSFFRVILSAMAGVGEWPFADRKRPYASFLRLKSITMQFDHLHVRRFDTSFGIGFLSRSFTHVVANLGKRTRTSQIFAQARDCLLNACNRWIRRSKADRWPFRWRVFRRHSCALQDVSRWIVRWRAPLQHYHRMWD